jgi:putative ABC transport system permease protein
VSLALATLIYEWRRYLAAVTALALSGLLVLAQVGLFSGLIDSSLAAVDRSRADIFILDPKTEDMVQGWSSLPRRVEPTIYMNPEVVEVASAERTGGAWLNRPTPGHEQVSTYVSISGVDTAPGAVTLPSDYPDAVRISLMEPYSVAVDASNLKRLGIKLGDDASLRGKLVHIRAVLHGYQSTQQPGVVVSRDTMSLIARSPPGGPTGPLMVRIKHPDRAATVVEQLNAASGGAYRAWTRQNLVLTNQQGIMKVQIIGLLLSASVFVAVLIGIGVTSQTMRGAILSNIKEFASLRALGVSMGSMRLIVMELSAWVGVAGLLAAGALTVLVAAIAAAVGLPMLFFAKAVIWVCVMLMTIAIVSGVMSMGVLKKSQPADLLR